MARVYLETSFISACVTNRMDVASQYRKQASNSWWAEQRHFHQLVISEEVIEELSHPEHRNREQEKNHSKRLVDYAADKVIRN